jgi:hypothetical protein
MSITSQTRFPRPPRVSVPGTVPATIVLENGRQLTARLQRISVTGGLLELVKYVEERVRVGLTLPVGSSVVYARAEILFPMRGGVGYLQPFRFTNLRDEQRHILDREITELLKQTVAPATGAHGSGFRPPRFFLETF